MKFNTHLADALLALAVALQEEAAGPRVPVEHVLVPGKGKEGGALVGAGNVRHQQIQLGLQLWSTKRQRKNRSVEDAAHYHKTLYIYIYHMDT